MKITEIITENTQGVAEGTEELAKQYGWAYNQGAYGSSMTHPKHGRISLSSPVTSRSGNTAVEREWTHNNASGVGDRSLAQHLQSLKEQGVAEGQLDPYRLERLDPQSRRVLQRMADHAQPGSWLSASEAYAIMLGLQHKRQDPRGWEQEVQHYVDLWNEITGKKS